MVKIKNILILILAALLVCICYYELHIIPRNGIGLNAVVFKILEICEAVLVLSLIVVSLTVPRTKKEFSSKLGTKLKIIYASSIYLLIPIAMFSNPTEPMYVGELNSSVFFAEFWPFLLVCTSIITAIIIGVKAIERLFPERNVVNRYLDNIAELENKLSTEIHNAVTGCEEEMNAFSMTENDKFILIHSKLQAIGLANLNSLKETESCKVIYKEIS